VTDRGAIRGVPRVVGAPATPGAAALRSSAWLFAFVLMEMGCQVALLSSSLAGARTIIRTAAFAVSVALLLYVRGSQKWHPAWPMALLSLAVLTVSIFHPESNVVAGVATIVLNLAVVGPIFWAPQIRIDERVVRWLFLVLWAFHTSSALVGALQMYFPGSFQPAYASIMSDESVQTLKITLANGERVSRPMGLTDTPGGAGIGATYGVLFAMALLLDRPRPLLRLALLASMVIGCFTLYLCQVRSLLIVLIVSSLTMGVVYAPRRGLGRTLTFAASLAGSGVTGLFFAVLIGGDAVTVRLSSLVESDPGTVYYASRGVLLEHTFLDLLPDYPLGAGLGRWGMMRTYFADATSSASAIWAEIQWSGWLLDGGVPLMIFYGLAIVLALREGIRTVFRTDAAGEKLHVWASALVGYSVGMLAFSFNTVPFNGTFGIDFWLLNATLFAASQQMTSSAPTPVLEHATRAARLT
jgi:hypothetical protein